MSCGGTTRTRRKKLLKRDLTTPSRHRTHRSIPQRKFSSIIPAKLREPSRPATLHHRSERLSIALEDAQRGLVRCLGLRERFERGLHVGGILEK